MCVLSVCLNFLSVSDFASLHVVKYMFSHFHLNKVNVFCFLFVVAVDVSLLCEMSMSPSD